MKEHHSVTNHKRKSPANQRPWDHLADCPCCGLKAPPQDYDKLAAYLEKRRLQEEADYQRTAEVTFYATAQVFKELEDKLAAGDFDKKSKKKENADEQ